MPQIYIYIDGDTKKALNELKKKYFRIFVNSGTEVKFYNNKNIFKFQKKQLTYYIEPVNNINNNLYIRK